MAKVFQNGVIPLSVGKGSTWSLICHWDTVRAEKLCEWQFSSRDFKCTYSTTSLERLFHSIYWNSTYAIFHDLAIPFLGTYPTEMCTYVHQKTCTRMFIAALFVRALNRKVLKCPSTVPWVVSGGVFPQWNTTQPWKWRNDGYTQRRRWNVPMTSGWGTGGQIKKNTYHMNDSFYMMLKKKPGNTHLLC